MTSWNNLMLTESDKYNIAKMIDKNNVTFLLEVTKEHNQKLDLQGLFSENSGDHFHLKPENISTIVKSYNYHGAKGIGLMFNIESFNKLNSEALIWVTFVNMNTGEVMITERMFAPPKGFGLRNYWAGAVYAVMDQVKSRHFSVWRYKYCKD